MCILRSPLDWLRNAPQRVAGAIFLAAAFWAGPACSAQSVAGFRVTVALHVPGGTPESAFCRLGPGPNTFGAVVTVVCATGAVVSIEAPRLGPMHGGAFRYAHLAESVLSGLLFPGGIDIYTGVGTITTWRIVNVTDWDYLEMQMAW